MTKRRKEAKQQASESLIPLRHKLNKQAIEHAERLIRNATGKPLEYYARRSRKEELVAYRSLFAYIAVECGASYSAVGKALKRSHATIIHAYNLYNDQATSWQILSDLRNMVIRYRNSYEH